VKVLAAIALIGAVALSGCISEPSEEQLTISISDVGKNPYDVVIPLWLWPGGPNATDWISKAAIHSGQVTQFHLVDTEFGPGIRIAGNGTVTLGFEDIRANATGRFWDGAPSMGSPSRADSTPRMLVKYGDIDVQWFYEAISKSCNTVGSYSWQANGTGEHFAQPGGRISTANDCQRL
jgi:hypothetical protein